MNGRYQKYKNRFVKFDISFCCFFFFFWGGINKFLDFLKMFTFNYIEIGVDEILTLYKFHTISTFIIFFFFVSNTDVNM